MKLLIFVGLVAAAVALPTLEDEAQGHFQLMYGQRFFGDVSNFKTASSDDFEKFIKDHKKTYANAVEKLTRFRVFQVNSWIAQAVQKMEQGSATYGVTKFSDMSPLEFKMKYRNLNMSNARVPFEKAAIPEMEAPESVDWVQRGAVTPVKNQQQCGSCWAFSTTGNIEGQWFLKKGQLISLSEQQLVDCDNLDQGCNGGLPSNAYSEIIRMGGLEKESAYPYTAQDGNCQFDKSKVVVTISGQVAISENEEKMATWCAANGPISIGINANNMQYYNGGVARPNRYSCDPSELDHGVLITGYGVDNGDKYWTVKNSWGPDWGESGYYRVVRGEGACGLNRMCTSSTV